MYRLAHHKTIRQILIKVSEIVPRNNRRVQRQFESRCKRLYPIRHRGIDISVELVNKVRYTDADLRFTHDQLYFALKLKFIDALAKKLIILFTKKYQKVNNFKYLIKKNI